MERWLKLVKSKLRGKESKAHIPAFIHELFALITNTAWIIKRNLLKKNPDALEPRPAPEANITSILTADHQGTPFFLTY